MSLCSVVFTMRVAIGGLYLPLLFVRIYGYIYYIAAG